MTLASLGSNLTAESDASQERPRHLPLLATVGHLLGKKTLTAPFGHTYSPACLHQNLHKSVPTRSSTRPRAARGFIAIWIAGLDYLRK